MTLLLSFHAAWGATGGPAFFWADEASISGGPRAILQSQFVEAIGTRDVLFAIHGFNVRFGGGAEGAVRLEAMLGLPPGTVFVGVLWPGDSWLPLVNYPFEGATANDCGKRLGRFCNLSLPRAGNISMLSHSLGARVALTAAEMMQKKVDRICLTAAAVNNDALENEFSAALKNTTTIANLASLGDWVLKIAFPVGDFLGDFFSNGPDSRAGALGRDGPRIADPAIRPTGVINEDLKHDHGDYFPPFKMPAAAAKKAKFTNAVGFMSRALSGTPPNWP